MTARLFHGDCLEEMKKLPDKSIDCFICDLPYGQLSGTGKQTRKRFINGVDTNTIITVPQMNCSWDVNIDLKAFWEQVERLAKADDTPVIHFCNTKFGIDLINSKPNWFRYDLVWNKERGVSFLSANKMPMKSHEMIYIFSKKGAFYNRIDEKVEGKKDYVTGAGISKQYGAVRLVKPGGEDGKRCVLSVINIKNYAKHGQHPTEKPKELYEWLLRRYCPAEGTILDPTAGSFNSVSVALSLGMNAVGIEKDEGFFNKGFEMLCKESE
jgi:site-specific DNA-methyltransferase (adenine-specific)